MKYTGLTESNTIPDEVKINLNMFGALMLHGVRGEVSGRDVVAVDHGSLGWRLMQLGQ